MIAALWTPLASIGAGFMLAGTLIFVACALSDHVLVPVVALMERAGARVRAMTARVDALTERVSDLTDRIKR